MLLIGDEKMLFTRALLLKRASYAFPLTMGIRKDKSDTKAQEVSKKARKKMKTNKLTCSKFCWWLLALVSHNILC